MENGPGYVEESAQNTPEQPTYDVKMANNKKDGASTAFAEKVVGGSSMAEIDDRHKVAKQTDSHSVDDAESSEGEPVDGMQTSLDGDPITADKETTGLSSEAKYGDKFRTGGALLVAINSMAIAYGVHDCVS
jgi:hypothetical protein